METKDRLGQIVRAGDRVKIIGLSEGFISTRLPEEQLRITEMIGAVFAIDEIDAGGQAGVVKWWSSGEGEAEAHMIGLAPSEMELASFRLTYLDGTEVMLGDAIRIEHGRTDGTVADVIGPHQVAEFNVDEPGIMIKSAPFGLVFFPVSSFTDVIFSKRGES